MGRRSLLTAEQMAEVRAMAQRAQADTRFRGFGNSGGRVGRNATEVVRDFIAETFGVEMSVRGVQALLGRVGLEYQHRAQGGFWAERR
jgi:transposase